MDYDHRKVEEKWQRKWEEEELSKAPIKDIDEEKSKHLLHFAYPNITGYMHIGHMRGYSYTDFIARKKRMEGYNILFPGGTHASGNNLIAFTQRIREKQEKWLKYMKENGATEEDMRKVGESPYEALEVFNRSYQETWKRYGLSFDMESWTSTIYPEYKKFIQWQFLKLREKGLLEQGEYYAPSCPEHGPVAVDPSETDIDKGGNAEKQEYTVLKFKAKDEEYYLTAATLRPETVFGQTNLFIDPEVEYVEADVDGEKWVVSQPAAEKLELQGKKVKVKEKIKGKKLLGKKVKAPGIDRWIPILPSRFCAPDEGTGIVTSVPSDAPYDWVGIKELKENPEMLKKYGVDPVVMESVEPISIIQSKGYGDYPAKEICEKMNIEDTQDSRLEEATKEIYKKGFHSGRMKENCGEYAGMPVEIAKNQVKEDMIRKGRADILHDLSEEVICRCGKKVNIKKIEDQWFINYGDSELTARSKKHAEKMDIKPKEYHENIQETLEWFDKRSATRQGNWLGTKLPWDEKWIIEPIADSTLYPAFYIVSKFVNRGELKEEHLTPAFFEYVFLKNTSPEEASKATGLSKEKLGEIRKAFDYWYPDDLNVGGKEHKTVHFPVFLMNHVAVMPEKYWPKSIMAHWYVEGKGGKISKSKGGARISPWTTAKEYGADAMRLFYGHASSPFSDIIFTEEKGESYRKHLNKLWNKVNTLFRTEGLSEEKKIDEWLKSRFNRHLKKAQEAFEERNFRKSIDELFFEFMKDVERYKERGGKNPEVTKEVCLKWIKSLAPYIPFICEELWEETGQKGLVSRASYPEVNEESLLPNVELIEEVIKALEEDIEDVMKLADLERPSRINIYTAPQWKRKAYKIARETRESVISEVMKVEEIKKKGKEAASYAKYLQKNRHKLKEVVLSEEEETNALKEAENYLKGIFGTKVVVEKAAKSSELKSSKALPMKPAILVE